MKKSALEKESYNVCTAIYSLACTLLLRIYHGLLSTVLYIVQVFK